MKYLVILLVLAAGCISGYVIGAHRGKAAVEALAAVAQAAKQEKAESDKAANALKQTMSDLEAAHKNEISRLQAGFQQQRTRLDAALAGKDRTIKEQTATIDSSQQEIERLHDRATSATDPAEKQALLDRVAQLENEKRNLASNVAGLKCTGVAVPDDLLGQLQVKQP